MSENTFTTTAFKLAWHHPADSTFTAEIALMYKHDNLATWNELSQEDRDYFDDEVFYYVYNEEELTELFDPNNHQDFYLIKEIN